MARSIHFPQTLLREAALSAHQTHGLRSKVRRRWPIAESALDLLYGQRIVAWRGVAIALRSQERVPCASGSACPDDGLGCDHAADRVRAVSRMVAPETVIWACASRCARDSL